MNERRGQDRSPVDLLLNKVQNGHTNVVRALDVSLNGMRLQRLLEPAMPMRTTMRLQFSLAPEDDPIWVGATTVWEDDILLGVRFTDISHRNFQRLRRWLEHRA